MFTLESPFKINFRNIIKENIKDNFNKNFKDNFNDNKWTLLKQPQYLIEISILKFHITHGETTLLNNETKAPVELNKWIYNSNLTLKSNGENLRIPIISKGHILYEGG